jgi:CBS domain containing-hemolysin-like protein
MAPAPLAALVVVLVFAGASFFFALAETALFSLTKWQARRLAERDVANGAIVLQLLADPQDLLAMMVLGNTVATAAMLAPALWMAITGRWWPAVTLASLLVLILFGCEVLPKTLAVREPERWALRLARALLLLRTLTRPLRLVAQRIISALIKLTMSGSVQPQSALTEADYQELIEMAYQQGTLAQSEKEIILQIINLDRRTARDVMRPRSRMAAISDELSIPEMLGAARRHKHRRLPIYDETPDTIVGVLNTRALLLDPNIDLAEAIELPSFVPETMNLLRLMKSLQRQQRGLAIVLDEFGGTAGIVTMEDILEMMIGGVSPEVESEGFVMEKLGTNRWRVSGALRLDDFRREYPALGEVEEAETIGGLLTSLLDVVPNAGESASFRGLKLTAQTVEARRVREVLVEVGK